MKDLIKYSYKCGVYVPSYDLAKAMGKKHQNLMTTVRRYYKFYIHYERRNHPYYKNQKVYLLTQWIIRKINKHGEYDKLLKEMVKVEERKKKEIHKQLDEFFKRFY